MIEALVLTAMLLGQPAILPAMSYSPMCPGGEEACFYQCTVENCRGLPRSQELRCYRQCTMDCMMLCGG